MLAYILLLSILLRFSAGFRMDAIPRRVLHSLPPRTITFSLRLQAITKPTKDPGLSEDSRVPLAEYIEIKAQRSVKEDVNKIIKEIKNELLVASGDIKKSAKDDSEKLEKDIKKMYNIGGTCLLLACSGLAKALWDITGRITTDTTPTMKSRLSGLLSISSMFK